MTKMTTNPTAKQMARRLESAGFGRVDITRRVMSRGHSTAVRDGVSIDVPLDFQKSAAPDLHEWAVEIGITGRWIAGMIRESRPGRLIAQARRIA